MKTRIYQTINYPSTCIHKYVSKGPFVCDHLVYVPLSNPQLAGLSEYGAFAQVDQQLRAPKAQPGWEALFQAVRKYTSNMAEQV